MKKTVFSILSVVVLAALLSITCTSCNHGEEDVIPKSTLSLTFNDAFFTNAGEAYYNASCKQFDIHCVYQDTPDGELKTEDFVITVDNPSISIAHPIGRVSVHYTEWTVGRPDLLTKDHVLIRFGETSGHSYLNPDTFKEDEYVFDGINRQFIYNSNAEYLVLQ